MLTSTCPSCGAALAFANKASLFAVCPHCDVASVREDVNLRSLGRMAELQDDGSPIQIGTTGYFRGRAFTVLGRRQMSYDKGFWNEWYLFFNAGSPGWLGEAMGLYSVLTERSRRQEVPSFGEFKIGQPFAIDSITYYVKNILKSECAGAEGELPFAVAGRAPAPAVDFAAEDNKCATIDFGSPAPRIFTGEYQPFDALSFKNLRRLEGW